VPFTPPEKCTDTAHGAAIASDTSAAEGLPPDRTPPTGFPPRILVGETHVFDTEAMLSFYGSGDELNLAFNFLLLHSRFEADAMRTAPVWTRPEAERKVSLEDSDRRALIRTLADELRRQIPVTRVAAERSPRSTRRTGT